MANEFTDSMENYTTLAQLLAKWNGPSAGVIAVGFPYAISAAAQGIQLKGNGGGQQGSITRVLAPIAHRFCGVRMKLQSGTSGNAIFLFADSNNVPQIRFDMNVGGTWTIRRGNATVLGTTTLTTAVGSTHAYEFEILIHGSAGTVNFWVDGVLYFTFTGNTQATSQTTFSQFEITCGSPSASSEIWINDAYVNDTTGPANTGREGGPTIRSYKVNSPGSSADFNRGGIDTGTNAGQLSKLHADSASFNLDFVVGHQDNFGMDAVASGTIKGARLWCYCQKDNSGGRQMGLTEKRGLSSGIVTPQLVPGPGYGWLSMDAGIDVQTGVLWASLSDLNMALWGYEITT